MELTKTRNGFYILISTTVIMLLLLGSWWLYLVLKLSNKLVDLNSPATEGNLIKMIQYEGITFFIMLISLAGALLYIYLQDHKKTKAMQAFFSSLTHELKTPLASIKLQAQVLSDHIEDNSLPLNEKERLHKYTTRLVNDALRLEDQLDNHLQLSRVEQDAHLNLTKLNFHQFIQKEIHRYSDLVVVDTTKIDKGLYLIANHFALQTIFRNLFENSIKHTQGEDVHITISTQEKNISYTDNGQDFIGDIKKLGTLFYKSNSPQGSGIGLYLIRKLMFQMNGKLTIQHDKNLHFQLAFYTGAESE